MIGYYEAEAERGVAQGVVFQVKPPGEETLKAPLVQGASHSLRVGRIV